MNNQAQPASQEQTNDMSQTQNHKTNQLALWAYTIGIVFLVLNIVKFWIEAKWSGEDILSIGFWSVVIVVTLGIHILIIRNIARNRTIWLGFMLGLITALPFYLGVKTLFGVSGLVFGTVALILENVAIFSYLHQQSRIKKQSYLLPILLLILIIVLIITRFTS
ncbi:MAG: hypothetical protein V1778_04980 [bacterium]